MYEVTYTETSSRFLSKIIYLSEHILPVELKK